MHVTIEPVSIKAAASTLFTYILLSFGSPTILDNKVDEVLSGLLMISISLPFAFQ
jgi:hypothetical protein